jgi:hypothetical protein
VQFLGTCLRVVFASLRGDGNAIWPRLQVRYGPVCSPESRNYDTAAEPPFGETGRCLLAVCISLCVQTNSGRGYARPWPRKNEGHMPEDKFLVVSRKGKRLGVAFASTPRGEGKARFLKFKTK